MFFILSSADAAILLGAFTSFILPFAHAWMKSNILPDHAKFIVAITLSVIGGYLSAVVGGGILTSLSVIQNAAIIGAAGAGIYVTFFGAFKLERVLYPRAALISEAQHSVAAQIGMMSKKTVRDAMDQNSSTAIRVTAERFDGDSAEPNSVLPKG